MYRTAAKLLIGLSLAYSSVESARAAEPLFSDLTGDGVVDFDDFFLFVDLFGRDCGAVDCGEPGADFNGDSVVDFDDFFLFVDQFGRVSRPLLRSLGDQLVDLGQTLSLPVVGSAFAPDTLALELTENPAPAHAHLDPATGIFTYRPGLGHFNQTFAFTVGARANNAIDSATIRVRVVGNAIDEDLLGSWERREQIGGQELVGRIEFRGDSQYVGQFLVDGRLQTTSQFPYTVVGDTLALGAGQTLSRAASGEFVAAADGGVEYVRYLVIGDALILFLEDVNEEGRLSYVRQGAGKPVAKLAVAPPAVSSSVRVVAGARGGFGRFNPLVSGVAH